MTKPHTLSLVVVESSSQRMPVVSAVQIVQGTNALSLVHRNWRDEHPTKVSNGIVMDVGGYANNPTTLG